MIVDKEKFKSLCVEVLPLINGIMEAVRRNGYEAMSSLTMEKDEYFSFGIHGIGWNMGRVNGGPVKIRYEYSEEISVPDGRAFDKVSENLVEISLAFANLQPEIRAGQEIDSLTWKQEFVAWANEFEQMYGNAEWGTAETGGKDYLEAIEEFAKKKIRQFAGMEG